MNKQNMSSIPDESKIEELLEKIQPLPSGDFHKKIKQTQWQFEKFQSRAIIKRPRFKYAVAILVTISITLIAVTPQGRAWAQEVAQFFQRINSTTIDASREDLKWTDILDEQYDIPLVPVFLPDISPEMAAIPECETAQKSLSYRCQVALAESELGFDLMEIPQKPENWVFKSLYFNKDMQSATMAYDLDFLYTTYTSNSYLTFTQGIGNFSNLRQFASPWDVVPTDKVQTVSIGTNKGEYVKGGFRLNAGDEKFVWNEWDREQRLAWSDGTRWYLIQYWPNLNIAEYWPDLNPTGTMNKEQLIQLAESLVFTPPETADPVNFDHLSSISDAEEVLGLDLKAPTLTPMDIDFSHARYFADINQVQLIYGLNEELTIVEWIGEPVEFNQPSDTHEIVKINGEVAYYGSTGGADSHLFLWWHKDRLNYQMFYDQSFGGTIDKDDMISIAESMQDIDDFQKKNHRNYEQLSTYEQALGIEIKNFPEAPVGWKFSNFWGDARARCIDMVYTAINEDGTLVISQCGTEKRSDISVFPFRSIERIKVGKNKGQYIAGGFITTGDGKQIWDTTMPVKQLYWQEDGLWIQITLYGNRVLFIDREDLIVIAESLQ